MPIHIASAYLSRLLALDALPLILASVAASSFLRSWSAGVDLVSSLDRATSQSEKEAEPGQKPNVMPRDLHGTVTIVVGGFTSQGLLTCAQLSSLGSQLVLLTPSIQSERIVQFVHLLRDGTSNPMIFAEECDVTSIASVEAFAAQWNLGEASGGHAPPITATDGGSGGAKEGGQAARPGIGPRRVDNLIFLPLDEARSGVRRPAAITEEGLDSSYAELLGRFHLVNLLLPSLFLLPPNRDIRIISLLSPWYAAGGTNFRQPGTSQANDSPWTTDGRYALLWYALSREIQRRIQLLTEADQRPRTKLPGIDDEGRLKGKATPTNVNLVNVCAGFERGRDVLDYLWPFREEVLRNLHDVVAKEDIIESSKPSEGQTGKLKEMIDPRIRQRGKPAANSPKSQVNIAKMPHHGNGIDQLKARVDNRAPFSRIIDVLQIVIVVILWPIAWILCKSPRRIAESVTWATIAPVRTDEVFHAAMKAAAVIPAELHREGRIIRPALPDNLLPGTAMQTVWKGLEASVKQILAKS